MSDDRPIDMGADAHAPARMPLETGMLPRWRAQFLGYDVFISYRHEDGLGYAMALENRLRALDLAVFRDARELAAGTSLREAIQRALNRSRMLVVVGTPAAGAPESWVHWEIGTFAKTHRPIIVINFGGAQGQFPALGEKDRLWLDESLTALEPPQPSDRVVQGIDESRTFMRRNRLGRIVMVSALACLLALSGGIWRVSRDAALDRQRGDLAREQADRERRVGDARRLAARSETLHDGLPSMAPESLAAAIEGAHLADCMETDRALRGALTMTAPLHHDAHLECSPDIVTWSGHTLAVLGSTGARALLTVMDLDRLRPPRDQDLDEDPLAASIDEDLLVVSQGGLGSAGSMLLTDAWTGKERCARIAGRFSSIAIAPGGTRVVAVGAEGTLVSVDPRSGSHTALSLGDPASDPPADMVTFSGRGEYLVATSSTGISVHRFSPHEEVPRLVLRQRFAKGDLPFLAHAPPFAFDSSERLLVLASGGTVRGYALPDGALLWTLRTGPTAALAIAGRTLLTHDRSKRVETYSMNDIASSERPTPETPGKPVFGDLTKFGARLSHDARDIVTHEQDSGGERSTVRLWDRVMGYEVGRLFHEGRVVALLEGRADDAYVTVGQDHRVRFWGDIHRREVEIIVPDLNAFALSGSHIAAAYGGPFASGRRISVWDGETGALRRDVPFRETVLGIHASEKEVVAATDHGVWTVRLEDVDSVPVNRVRFPFEADAATFQRRANSAVLAAIDGRGHGVVYRGEPWTRPQEFNYRNPVNPQHLDPWGSGSLTLRSDTQQLGIALTGAIVFVALGREPPLPEVPMQYRVHAFAFGPSSDWLAVASMVDPEASWRNPIPALDIVFHQPSARSHTVLDWEGNNPAIAVSPRGDQVAVAVGKVLQIRSLPEPGAAPEEIVKQIELPWDLKGLQYSDSGDLWAWGDQRIRRIRLDVSALEAEARRRLGSQLR